jgi:hypothetical protein
MTFLVAVFVSIFISIFIGFVAHQYVKRLPNSEEIENLGLGQSQEKPKKDK